MSDMVRYSLRWGNPYTEPTGPRIKLAVLVPRGASCPPEILAIKVPGDGYAVCWELVSQRPIRRWSTEAKARARKRNLRARLERRVPLFAEIFIAEELERRPSYFSGGDEDFRGREVAA